MRKCKGCGIGKRIKEFNISVSNKDGRSLYCKACQAKIKHKYYTINRKRILERQKYLRCT